MGACASKSKESNHDSLPDDNPASYDQMLEGVGADPTVENGAEVVTENKEKSLMDNLGPKQEALNSDGESKVEQDTAITGPVPEISRWNPELGDPEKVSEAGVKSEDHRQEHETSDAVSVVGTQKPDAGGEEAATNSENLKKLQDVEKPPLSE